MNRAIGEPVRSGETLASVTSSESLQTYAIPSPISGVVMARNANVGDVAGTSPIYVIADATASCSNSTPIRATLSACARASRSWCKALSGENNALRDRGDPADGRHDDANHCGARRTSEPGRRLAARAGGGGRSCGSRQEAPLAVRTRALQRFRDFTVVFARVGETYEVRMLELGRQTPEWTEVLGGLAPGEVYVSDNAFLIRADIEKSGASHDH
jgi:cobalt-zinc-cadmium efflux system membrane fusion protein